ncbi:MAG: 5'-methylthioadenosine/adenosylhomocysteine nucleosidase, partial [Eubacteriales bacterium]
GACAAEMEGGAIAQVCYLYKTPFAVLRTMSDGADGDASGDFAAFAEQAAQISSLAILSLFTE